MFFGLLDFAALSPEVNSGRMYTGPGSGPMLAAAAAWDSVGAEVSSAASTYESVVSGLLSEAWSGPTATSMAVAASRYAAWLGETAVQAEHSAVQARAAAAAHDAALTAMVPPPVIAANRSLSASLVATNILGQNTPAIAATELHYMEMWAQDAAAMFGYAAASAAATMLSPFTDPPPTTTSDGEQLTAAPLAAVNSGAQSTVSQLLSMGPHALAAVAAPTQATGPIATVLDALAGPLGPASLYGIAGVPYLLAIQCVLLPMNGSNVVAAVARAEKAAADGIYPRRPVALAGENFDGIGSGPRLVGSGPSSARLGGSGSVGRLSVPQTWTAATPMARTVAAALPGAAPSAATLVAAEGESGLMSDLALGSLAGRAIGATGGAASNKIAGATGSVAASKPSTATIIVIPPSAED